MENRFNQKIIKRPIYFWKTLREWILNPIVAGFLMGLGHFIIFFLYKKISKRLEKSK